METKQLKKLRRSELLGMLLQRSKELERVQAELDAERAAHTETKETLDSQRIAIEESGSIAEATVRISGIMEEAQAAADQYLQRVREQAEEETASLKTAKQSLEAKRDLLTALQVKLDDQVAELKQDQEALAAGQASLADAQKELEEERRALEEEREALAASQRALEAEKEELESARKLLEKEQEALAVARSLYETETQVTQETEENSFSGEREEEDGEAPAESSGETAEAEQLAEA